MINVSFKNLLRKERTEHCQGRLLPYNRIFCWGITLYSSRVILKYSISPMIHRFHVKI